MKPCRVAILQYRLLHYRLELFERLRGRCAANGIELHVVHGQPTAQEETKKDTGFLRWADVVRNRYVTVGDRDVLWQPFPRHLNDIQLVIMMQESRLISNYRWLLFRGGIGAKLAYWGHGRNFQSVAPTGFRERWKKLLLGKVDWWFAYTELTRSILLESKYPDERITVLNNAIDNESFARDLESIDEFTKTNVRGEFDLSPSAMIGLFCGSMYPDKRLDFLVAAADLIRDRIRDFHMILIGDGPSASVIRVATERRPWLHWLGVKNGRDKAKYFSVADVVLNPGGVGLHVLESFAARVPLITTSDALHGPEIAYLEDNVNGMIVAGGVEKYAAAVVQLLKNRSQLASLRKGALEAAGRYTLSAMVNRFADGIERCLANPTKCQGIRA